MKSNSALLKMEVELLLNRVKHVGANTCVTSTLLEGEKGAGKTFLSTTIAKLFCGNDWESNYLFYQCNEGTSPAHFLYDIDVQGVVESVAGNENKIFLKKWIEAAVDAELRGNFANLTLAKEKITYYSQNSPSTLSKGILIQACEKSKYGKVVLVIDELDKTSRSVDAFLLDFLQNFRVKDPIYGEMQGNKENIIVIFTSNGERLFSEPLYRRFVTIHVEYPSQQELLKRVKSNIKTKFSDDFILEVIKMVEVVRSLDLFYKPTISEIMTLLIDLESLKNRNKDELLYFVTRTMSPDIADREIISKHQSVKSFISILNK